MNKWIDRHVDRLTDEERVILAAEILNLVVPNKDNMHAFIEALDEDFRDELANRLEE